MAYKSIRSPLVAGSGTVTIGSHLATFSQAQDFKKGAIIQGNTNSFVFTIVSGSEKKWQVLQTGGLASQGFKISDTTSTRARGSAASSPAGLPAGASLFLYISHLDSSGNPDMYLYFDSLW